MVTDRFGAILEELGSVMNIKLVPDKFNSCLIRLPNKLEFIMKPSASDDEILAIVEIGQPGTGPYRLNILKEALMSNAQTEAKSAIFCYGIKKDELVLYRSISLTDLTGRQLFDIMNEMCELAQNWKDCLSRAELPQRYASAPGPSIFGLQGRR
jgi:hypothetical protein